jgi:glycosyltransferase involved in cell wall biosynthesis
VRLAVVTQVIDADHPALAQTIDIVDALARRCEEVVVICDHVGRYTLPANVRLRTFGSSSRLGRGLRFEQALVAELMHRDARFDALLAHMIPTFLTLAAPLCKPLRIPLGLWYTHWNADPSLRRATRLADVVLSVDKRSFPLDSPKVKGIGHAIDLAQFPVPQGAKWHDGPLRILALGRITAWKGYTTMLEGLELATAHGLDATLEIRGPTMTEAEEAHLAELRRIVAASPVLGERVSLEPALPREEVLAALADADVLLSATQPERSETLDKVVYEAAAAGVPVLSSNVALDEFLGGLPVRLRFARRDAPDLARALLEIANAGPVVRSEVGAELRRRVEEGHSVESWADAVLRELAEAHGNRRDRGSTIPA